MIHEKNNYIIKITNLGNSTIDVTFPKNIFLNMPELNVIFLTTEDSVIFIEDETENEKIMPDYCHRLFIIKEITRQALSRNMSQDFVNVTSIIEKLSSPKDILKEKKIFENFHKILTDQEVDEDIKKDLELIKEETFFEDIID